MLEIVCCADEPFKLFFVDVDMESDVKSDVVSVAEVIVFSSLIFNEKSSVEKYESIVSMFSKYSLDEVHETPVNNNIAASKIDRLLFRLVFLTCFFSLLFNVNLFSYLFVRITGKIR